MLIIYRALLLAGNLDDFHIFHDQGFNYRRIVAEARGIITERNKSGLKPSDINFDEIPNSDLAGLLYTSGTTGFSKGVMLSHNSLIANIDYAQKSIPLKAKDSIVSFLPLAHCFGCALTFYFRLLRVVIFHSCRGFLRS